jgi:hypothetical protein
MPLYDLSPLSWPSSAWIVAAGLTLTAFVPARTLAQTSFTEDIEAGVDFRQTSGRSASKFVPEIMGSGLAWLDFDIDGRWDLYFVDAGILPDVVPLAAPAASAGTNRVFRGNADGFDAVASTGLEDPGYGMGVAAADYDNDGWIDIYVTNYGADVLLRNNGDGTFEDVSNLLPPATRWSASAAWGDLDGDSWLDLYVTSYLDYPLDSVPLCTHLDKGIRQYCAPQRLNGASDYLLHNQAGQRFVDITARAGVENAAQGKGLAVVVVDLTEDGLPDIYVANDSTGNFLYVNRGDLTFEEQGLISGAGLNDLGQPQSGMGIDVGDLDGDGAYEIGVSNFTLEPVNIYSRLAPGLYMDTSFLWGIGEPTLDTLGFGLAFLDVDGDSDLEIVVANGHILDDHAFFEQPNQLFNNTQAEARGHAGAGRPSFAVVNDTALATPRVSRGLAVADYNSDGRPDLAVSNNSQSAQLFRNTSTAPHHRLVVRLRGTIDNRDAVGATLHLVPLADTDTLVRQAATIMSGASYLSRHSGDLHFGLGHAARVGVEVEWPDGQRSDLGPVAADQLILIQQGRGLTAVRALEDPR